MKFSSSAMAAVLLTGALPAASFSIQSSLSRVRLTAPYSMRMAAESKDDYFESILGEGSSYRDSASALQNAVSSSSSSSPVIRVPDGSPAATVTLASTAAASSDIYGDDLSFEGEVMEEADEEDVNMNPLLNNEILKRQHEKKLKREERRASGDAGVMRYVKNPLLLVKGKDFSDITITVLIPAFVSYLALRKVAEIGFGRLGEKAEALYDKAAADITNNVGDFGAMERIYKDYKKKLWFNGAPSYIDSQILKRLAVAYCTTISVTPASVSSLAYLLTMMNVTEDEAADTLILACRENPNSMAISAKVLFYSEHVFKEKSAKKKMSMLIERLVDMFGAMEPVMQQQKDMAESAYRDAVAEAGPGQTKLTDGWKVLGLEKDTAERIYEETKALGFLTRQELWQKEEDDRARAVLMEIERRQAELRASIDKDGNLIDPNAEVDPSKLITDEDLNKYENEDDDEEESGGTMGQTKVKECGKCKYTLFIAAGREKRFFPPGFTCPQCGAPRDQFKDVDIDE